MNYVYTRRQLLSASSAVALPWLASCRRPAPSAGMREIKVAFVPRITVAGLYLAEEQGFFREAGINLAKATERKNEYFVPLMTSGKIDVAFVQVNPALLNAVASGARIRIVAGRDVASRTCGSIGTLYGMRKNFPKGFTDLRVLQGKRVAISGSTNLEAFCLDTDLASVGLTTADVEVIHMEQAQSIVALVDGGLGAVVCNFLQSFPEGLSPEIVRGPGLADLFPGMQYNFVAFGKSLLDDDPSIGASFLKAFFRGARVFASGKHSKNLLAVLNRELGMDPQLLFQSCRSGSVLDGGIDRPSIQRMLDWNIRKGFCSEPLKLSGLIDTRFIDAMNGRGSGG